MSTGCASKNISVRNFLYISNSSARLNHTFAFYLRVVTKHILHSCISSEHPIWLNRYSALNFKVYFLTDYFLALGIFTKKVIKLFRTFRQYIIWHVSNLIMVFGILCEVLIPSSYVEHYCFDICYIVVIVSCTLVRLGC